MTNALEYYRKAVKQLEESGDPAFSLCYPRKYRIPDGYLSPKLLVPAALSSALFMTRNDAASNPTLASIFVAIQRLVEFKVPTYFADETLCASLAATDPPEDMKLSEIKWPMPAVLFMLGDKFSMQYLGRKVVWVSAAKLEPGQDIDCRYDFGVRPFAIPENVAPCISICADVVDPAGGAASFHCNKPLDSDVKEMMHDPITYFPVNFPTIGATGFDAEKDGSFFKRLASIVLHLLMLTTARPEMVEEPVVEKKINGGKGHAGKIELWSPRWIGRGYKPPHERASSGGHHASPEIHWRRAHWRNQAVGPGRKERKLTWIEMQLIGGGDEKEAAA